jgi:phage tail sheath protein FI
MPIYQGNALNTTALVVPDLYVQILPPSIASLNGVPTNVLGIVGTASWGPVNVPTVIGTPSQQAQTFGPVKNRSNDLGTAVAIAALQGAQNFRCVRVTDGTDTAATATLGTSGITITARYTGTLGNGITVTIAQSPLGASYWNVTIGLAATGQAQTFPNITGTGNAFWLALAAAINNGIANSLVGPSPIVAAVAGAGTASPTAGTTTLSGGTDGVATITTAVMIGSNTVPYKGMYALQNQGCSIGMLADLSDVTSFSTQVAFGLSNGIYMIGTMPASTGSPSSTEVAQQTALIGAGASSYAFKCMFGDWVYWADQTNQVTRLVSPQAFEAGLLSNLAPNQSSCNKPLYGVIGTQQSGLPGSNQSQTYASADLQVIFGSGSAPSFDVITNPIPGGANWGTRGGFNTSAQAGINDDSYTRMTNYIASTLNAGMGVYVGQPITPSLFNNITATLTTFLGNLLQQGLLAMITNSQGQSVLPFTVTCGPSNNPQSQTGIGIVQANVSVTYEGINKIFIINLQGGSTVVQQVN